ncbi:MAG: (2Fe-2S)-binding protein [Steroidobacteraceae bacterium]
MSAVELRVNGVTHALETDPETALLYVLRNTLGCKGVRFGCGTGHCGACTVLVDGQSAQSCDMPLSAAAAREVTTIEAICHDPVGSVLRDAFLLDQAAQCAYCINGILASATALLRRTLTPSSDDIGRMLHRHLCRCGAHQRIVKAIDTAAARLRAQAAS